MAGNNAHDLRQRETPMLALLPGLKRDDDSSNRHHARGCWWSMIFSENRCTLLGIML